MNTKMNDETKMETAKSQYPNRGETSEYYCDVCEDEPLLHDGEGGYYCDGCDFEDCECGYTHHYEDKCPTGENTKHYEKCDDDDEEQVVWLDYSDFVENFEPKKDYSKIQEDDTIAIQYRPAESKNKARRESGYWCAFEWKHESEEKWKLMEYNGSSAFAMWWCQMIE